MEQSKSDQTQPSVQEIKIAEGIYFTDFRQKRNPQLKSKGLIEFYEASQKRESGYVPSKNPLLLEREFNEFKSKKEQLTYTIKEILEIENYQDDPDFVDAIFDNYKAIQKFLANMSAGYILMAQMDPKHKIIQ